MEKVAMNNIINTKRWPLLFIKAGALAKDEQALPWDRKYLLPQAVWIQFIDKKTSNKHSNIHSIELNLSNLYTVLTDSLLLFVVSKQIFRNYNVYNRLNSTIKRTRIDVGGLIYGN